MAQWYHMTTFEAILCGHTLGYIGARSTRLNAHRYAGPTRYQPLNFRMMEATWELG